MNHTEIRTLARTLLDQHGLHDWKIRISSAARQFGLCTYRTKTISISGPLAEANGESITRDTILHEIAHALAGHAAGHGPAWKAVCRRIGATPERTAQGKPAASPWMRVCANCNSGSPAYRRSKTTMACAKCCNRYNGGKFSRDYLLSYVPTERYTP